MTNNKSLHNQLKPGMLANLKELISEVLRCSGMFHHSGISIRPALPGVLSLASSAALGPCPGSLQL